MVIRPKPSKTATKWRLVQHPNPKGTQGTNLVSAMSYQEEPLGLACNVCGIQRWCRVEDKTLCMIKSMPKPTNLSGSVQAVRVRFPQAKTSQAGSFHHFALWYTMPQKCGTAGAQMAWKKNHLVSKCQWKLNEQARCHVVSIWEPSPAAPIV